MEDELKEEDIVEVINPNKYFNKGDICKVVGTFPSFYSGKYNKTLSVYIIMGKYSGKILAIMSNDVKKIKFKENNGT